MDRLTHISLNNCIKELESLSKLVETEKFSYKQISDFIREITWNLSNVFERRRYNSDEFQFMLQKIIKQKKMEDTSKKDLEEDKIKE